MSSGFLVAALVAALAGFPTRRVLIRYGVIDRPNARSSHSVPTARGGGLSFLGIAIASLVVGGREEPALIAFAIATLLLAFVGFVDDLRSIGVVPRLVCHALVALVPATLLALDAPTDPSLLALAALAFVGTVGFTNAFNFMDGIDGIAATHAILGFVATAVLARQAGSLEATTATLFAIAGSVAGFLPWNFPRARMFMGDVASAPLGYLLASSMVLVVRDGGLGFVLPFTLVHLGFVLDTTITLVRRARRGERLRDAHREHFYQRLVRSGLGHPIVTGLYAVLTAAASATAIALEGRPEGEGILALTLFVALWLGLFAYAERRFRRTLAVPPAP